MRRRLALVVLAAYTYGTFASLYWPGSGADPGLYGYAPQFLLSTVLGCGVAAVTDSRVTERSQVLRLAWYPGWAVVASLPLYLGLAARGDPAGSYWTYHVVIGGVVGVGREIGRW